MSLLTTIINNEEGLYKGDLRYYFKQLFNSRGADNPYHNIRHSLDVLIKCYDAIKFYSDRPEKLDKEIARALLLSALFHDFNHSGRAGNDDLNIELALRAWQKSVLTEDADLSCLVRALIKSTEFGPQGHVIREVSFECQILRDADLSQICSVAWIRMIIFGLAQEMNISPTVMLQMQEPFLSKVKFETEWGQKFGPLVQEKLTEARALQEILAGV